MDCAVWELTLKCNLHCSHCGSSAGCARDDELSLSECFSVCEQLTEVDCDMVSLMGGEPFIHPEWEKIGRCVKDLGMKLGFVSNGLLIPQNITKIKALDPIVVGVSLDGVESHHNSIRGPGTFRKAIAAIDTLRAADIQTTVITTVSTYNFGDLPHLQRLLYPKKVNWQIQIALPFGNFDRDKVISPSQFYALCQFIYENNLQNRFNQMPIAGGHCLGYFSHLYPHDKSWEGCTAGRSTIGITSNGNILGCLSMGNNDFIEGNIRSKRLKEIWDDPHTFAYNRGFTVNQLGSHCTRCKYGSKCKGGCAAVSYHLQHEFHNTPYCMRQMEEKYHITTIPRRTSL